MALNVVNLLLEAIEERLDIRVCITLPFVGIKCCLETFDRGRVYSVIASVLNSHVGPIHWSFRDLQLWYVVIYLRIVLQLLALSI